MEKIYGRKGVVLPSKIEIPVVDDERLMQIYRFLKPIVTIDQIKYLLREYSLQEIKNQSYIWTMEGDKREEVHPDKLEVVEDFLCFHTYAYSGFFKPSIAEVLAQAPVTSLKEANLFEIIEQLEYSYDLNRYPEVINKGFHLSKVRTYQYHK